MVRVMAILLRPFLTCMAGAWVPRHKSLVGGNSYSRWPGNKQKRSHGPATEHVVGNMIPPVSGPGAATQQYDFSGRSPHRHVPSLLMHRSPGRRHHERFAAHWRRANNASNSCAHGSKSTSGTLQ